MTWNTPPTNPPCGVSACATCPKIDLDEYTAYIVRLYRGWHEARNLLDIVTSNPDEHLTVTCSQPKCTRIGLCACEPAVKPEGAQWDEFATQLKTLGPLGEHVVVSCSRSAPL